MKTFTMALSAFTAAAIIASVLTINPVDAQAWGFGDDTPKNIMTTSCSSGVADAVAGNLPHNTISILPDGTIVSKNDFERGTLKAMASGSKAYLVPKYPRMVFYNPAIPNVILNRYEDGRGNEWFTNIVILDPAQQADIAQELADFKGAYTTICTGGATQLDSTKAEWIKGLGTITANYELGGAGAAYKTDPKFVLFLKKHLPGVRVTKADYTYSRAAVAHADEANKKASGIKSKGTKTKIYAVDQVYHGETTVKDPAAALHSLIDPVAQAAFNADLKVCLDRIEVAAKESKARADEAKDRANVDQE